METTIDKEAIQPIVNRYQETHDKLVVWYNLCLDLDYDAINEYPSELERYLQKLRP